MLDLHTTGNGRSYTGMTRKRSKTRGSRGSGNIRHEREETGHRSTGHEVSVDEDWKNKWKFSMIRGECDPNWNCIATVEQRWVQ